LGQLTTICITEASRAGICSLAVVAAVPILTAATTATRRPDDATTVLAVSYTHLRAHETL
jgi:hypothetical protein